MNKILYILGVVALGIAEFLGYTWLLKYSFTAFSDGRFTLVSCGVFIIFLMWLGKKLDKLISGGKSDGK